MKILLIAIVLKLVDVLLCSGDSVWRETMPPKVIVQVANLPAVPTFDAEAGDDQTGLGPRWDKWLKRFTIYMQAAGVEDDGQQRALLLHCVGPNTYDKFETLGIQETTYISAHQALTAYFKPKVNVEYERAVFRRAKQEKGECIDAYCTRLRELATTCNFADKNGEIKSQLIQMTSDSKLRRHALVSDKSLDDILTEGRSNELCKLQNLDMEKQLNTESVRQLQSVNRGRYGSGSRGRGRGWRNSGEKPNNPGEKPVARKCFSCGRRFPHAGGKTSCPAYGKDCNNCGKQGHFAKFCKSTGNSGKDTGTGASPHTKFRTLKSVHYVDEEDSSDDERYLFALSNHRMTSSKIIQPPKFIVQANGIKQEFTADTAATVCVMDMHTYSNKFHDCILNKANPIKVYGGTLVYPVGKFDCHIKCKGRQTTQSMYVLEGNCCLLSIEASVQLGLITIADHVINTCGLAVSPEQKSKVISARLSKQFPKLGMGIGKITDSSGKPLSIKLHIDGSVPPVAKKYSRTPFRLRGKVEEKLKELEENDIIEGNIVGPTPWVSNMVIAGKPKNPDEIRLCINMQPPNKAITRTRHPIPTLNEIKQEVSGSKVFSKLDLKSGYHQLELAEESRYITTFSTHLGLRRFKRLNFGVNSASEIFQDAISNVLRDVSKAFNISDDIIIHGRDQDEHDCMLLETCQTLSDRGATLNWPKCQFSMPELEFYGMVFNGDGMKPDPKKIESVKLLEAPSSKVDVSSFLGMTTYLSQFIPNYSTVTSPLREVMKDNVQFKWGEEQQSAFDELKDLLSSDTVMAYFDPNRPASIDVDASPVGIGGILTQSDNQGREKVIAYGSVSLNEAEQNYPQIEREGLAVAWGLEHFHEYVYGEPVTVYTDHQPLESIYGKPRKKLNGRLERWSLRLQPYDATVKYRKGRGKPSDYMSRHVVNTKSSSRSGKVAEEYVNFLTSEAVPKSMTLKEMREATDNDPTLSKVKEFIQSGKWYELKHVTGENIDMNALVAYSKIRDELCIVDRIILRGHRIAVPQSLQNQVVQLAIPQSLQKKVVQLAHEGHQGEVKTKALLRTKVWFPGMDALVSSMIKSCRTCLTVKHTAQREPLQMTELPKSKWTNLAADFYGPLPSGHHILVVIDEYSRFPEVEVLSSVGARHTIPALDRIFSSRGFPDKLKTDNGPPFNSKEFAEFAEVCGFEHNPVTPYWPEANGNAESFMKNLGKVCKSAQLENRPWRQELTKFLRNYRATPHTTTGIAPASLLNGYEMKTKLPQINIEENDLYLRTRDKLRKQKMKQYAEKRRNIKQSNVEVGDQVLLKHAVKKRKSDPIYQEEPFQVVNRKGSQIIAQRGDEVKVRNSSYFKKIHTGEKPLEVVPEDDIITAENAAPVQTGVSVSDSTPSDNVRASSPSPLPCHANVRPQRQRQRPVYLNDYDLSQ